MKLITKIILIVLLAWCASCNNGSEPKEIDSIVRQYFAAIKSEDKVILKGIMTPELWQEYDITSKQMKSALNISKSFGVKVPSIKNVKLVNVKFESIQGDFAYVNIEAKLNEKVRFEKIILKRIMGKWKVAGKQ